MTWLVLSNGAEQPLSGPGAMHAQYTVASLAHQLAQINRYTGATRRPYSVAEHSLLCADLAADAGHTPLVQLCCLMHDAHECITGDITSPVKWHLGEPWTKFENPHAHTLRRHFRLTEAFVTHGKRVRHFDLVALATERRELLPFNPAVNTPWPVIDTPGQEVPAADGYHLRSMWRDQRHWTEWRDAFTQRYAQLREELKEAA